MIRKYLVILAAVILTLSFFLSKSLVFAVEKENVNPGDDYRYVIKRLEEKIILVLLSFSPSRKADYYTKLVSIRLSELKYVVDRKDIANIQTASQRYSAFAGQLSEFILKKNLGDYKEKTKKLLSSHIPLLEDLRNSYPGDTAEWRFIEDDINSLKLYLARLSD